MMVHTSDVQYQPFGLIFDHQSMFHHWYHIPTTTHPWVTHGSGLSVWCSITPIHSHSFQEPAEHERDIMMSYAHHDLLSHYCLWRLMPPSLMTHRTEDATSSVLPTNYPWKGYWLLETHTHTHDSSWEWHHERCSISHCHSHALSWVLSHVQSMLICAWHWMMFHHSCHAHINMSWAKSNMHTHDIHDVYNTWCP